MKRYYMDSPNPEIGLEEVTELEYLDFIGDEALIPYIDKVYTKSITLEEVPEDARVLVEKVVGNWIKRWGNYNNDAEITAEELKSMIEEVL